MNKTLRHNNSYNTAPGGIRYEILAIAAAIGSFGLCAALIYAAYCRVNQ